VVAIPADYRRCHLLPCAVAAQDPSTRNINTARNTKKCGEKQNTVKRAAVLTVAATAVVLLNTSIVIIIITSASN
jgi:hypothetical protein